jgi:hypothetical protein
MVDEAFVRDENTLKIGNVPRNEGQDYLSRLNGLLKMEENLVESIPIEVLGCFFVSSGLKSSLACRLARPWPWRKETKN